MAFRENRSFGTTYYLYINSDGNLYEKSNEPKEGFVQHINPNSGQPAGYWKEYYNGVVGYINYIGLKSSSFSNGNTVTNFLIVLKDYELMKTIVFPYLSSIKKEISRALLRAS